MTHQKPFRILIYLILTFTLIYLVHLTNFIFIPIGLLLAAIAVPIVGAGLLFYISSPLVNLLERYKVKRVYGALIIFLLIGLFGYLISLFLVPPLQEQTAKLIENVPAIAVWVEEVWELWQNRQEYLPAAFEDSIQNVIDNLDTYANQVFGSLFSMISSLFSFLFSFIMIPFFLFFMLKDGKKLIPFITQFFSEKKAKSIETLLHNINKTLSSFIQGQVIVSLCVGVLLLIGYYFVGLNYALVLALFGLFMNLIPFIGPWISAVPAVIIGFFQDPMIGVWTAVIMIVAQQIESNFISPNVMGKALNLHPLTVITVILAAGAMFGFIGLLFAVPSYAVAKTIISHIYHVYTNSRPVGKKNII
ncbi:AI-2E family transporter [Halolactibacillus alkaliphilus]|uniref:AI-2E family transporter n=1 Tax=Halolactibacillus alkaliphilus TaxID=442899 RepID=A0A511X282_9BACI|nr:AI-2E family transporter [Halolactibacillus alkaliphilus]GEN57057.1 AI-2E family transporter [Halolactibacillus alkaliphilus]GGN68657.1 AI-2E family transporter [Halolactibacillus alkaliphilus]SFO86064.1 Predicted PurR-regulated permease PerM [Halolactibacillus alkaliphilus]